MHRPCYRLLNALSGLAILVLEGTLGACSDVSEEVVGAPDVLDATGTTDDTKSVDSNDATPGAGADLGLTSDTADSAESADSDNALDTDDSSFEDSSFEDSSFEDSSFEDSSFEDSKLEDSKFEDSTSEDSSDATDDTVTLLTEATPPAEAACGHFETRRLYDRVLLRSAGALAMWDSEGGTLSPFGPGLPGLTGAPLSRPGVIGSAEVLASTSDGAECRVVGLDASGGVVFDVGFSALSCSPLASSASGVVLGTTVPEGARVERRSTIDGALVGVAALPGPSTTTPSRLASGELTVGHGGTVSVLSDSLTVLASANVDLTEITRIVTGEGGLVLALGRSSDVSAGLGDRLVRLHFDGTTLTTLDVATLDGAALAEPVVLDGCLDPAANGSSHWWCPNGLVAVGGAGFLAIYDLLTGAVVTSEVVTGDVTGLATLADGRILSMRRSGNDATMVALDILGGAPESVVLDAVTAAAPETPPCPASPLVEEDGRARWVALAALRDVETRAGGPGPGWARSGGDVLGGGDRTRAGAPCAPTEQVAFARDLRLAGGAVATTLTEPVVESITAATVRDDGELFLAGGQVPSGGATTLWLRRLSASGFVRWETKVGDATESVAAVATLGTRIVAVGTRSDGGVTARVIALSEAGDVTGDAAFSSALGGSRAVDVAPLDEDVWGVLVEDVDGLGTTAPRLLIVDVGGLGPSELDSVPLDWGTFDAGASVKSTGGALFVGGYTVEEGNATAPAVVQRIEPDGSSPWTRLLSTTDVTRQLIDLQVVDGVLMGLERWPGAPTERGAVVLLDPSSGDVLSETVFTAAPKAIAMGPDGRPRVLTDFATIVRLDGPNVDVLADLADDAGTVFFTARALLPAPDGSIVAGTLSDSSSARGRVIRTTALGATACGVAGRCLLQSCDDQNACTVDTCDPATGACANDPRAVGSPCGTGLACDAVGTCL
ncbi:MAG: hypothetical protein IV100_09065 [Myxococcales bacterium]|nr:hypothetical protein [Myxococcales bacterium]